MADFRPLALSRVDAAKYLGLHLSTFDRLTKKKVIKPHPLFKSFSLEDLERVYNATKNGDTEEGRPMDGEAESGGEDDLRVRPKRSRSRRRPETQTAFDDLGPDPRRIAS